MKRLFRNFLGGVLGAIGLVFVLAGMIVASFYWNASHSDWPRAGRISEERLPESSVAARQERQLAAQTALELPASKQILFGDLHVHSSYSTDAMAQGLPALHGEGAHPPADACDFARFCSALDFWSINDHAESLTSSEWALTRDVIRNCNQVAGDPANPDLVSFLGWEWSQTGRTPETHFGHKNVVMLGIEEDEVPLRPIASAGFGNVVWGLVGLGMSLGDLDRWDQYADVHRATIDAFSREQCESGVDVHDLPADCHEIAATPADLFEKLDQWGLPSIVIPHGLAWGTTNPRGQDLAYQLGGDFHDPSRQRLIEVYSGHGNSEVFAGTPAASVSGSGEPACPAPTAEFEPCCWRAGEIVRARCPDPQSAACLEEVAAARSRAASGSRLSPVDAVEGSTIEDFGECGQLRQAFLPAFNYRPGGSAQYGLALGDFTEPGEPKRFRLGLMASSDNHRARAGSGYKEFGRTAMTDGAAMGSDWRDARASSFYYTGGLVAVHADGRDRNSIFDALHRREVYGTSGDRILLWFDLLGPDGVRVPMGSEAEFSGTPRFEVRAAGAFEQRPGCPKRVEQRLSPERLKRLCLGECYFPGENRRAITRIEVVRIRPQGASDEAVGPLIEDPWKVLECPGDEAGCQVSFEDPEFSEAPRESLYYVRAIQEESLAVNGDPLACERDANGVCVRGAVCQGGGEHGPPVEDCLGLVEERAWSSPIFLDVGPPR